MRLTPTLFVLFHYIRGCVTTDNTRDKTFKPFGFATVDVNRRGLHLHIVCLSFPLPTIGIKYVQIQNIRTTIAVLFYGHVFPLRLTPVQELKKTRENCCIVQVTCKTVAFRFFLTHSEVRVPWFSLRSRVSCTPTEP